jgi:hypothetical protein
LMQRLVRNVSPLITTRSSQSRGHASSAQRAFPSTPRSIHRVPTSLALLRDCASIAVLSGEYPRSVAASCDYGVSTAQRPHDGQAVPHGWMNTLLTEDCGSDRGLSGQLLRRLDICAVPAAVVAQGGGRLQQRSMHQKDELEQDENDDDRFQELASRHRRVLDGKTIDVIHGLEFLANVPLPLLESEPGRGHGK